MRKATNDIDYKSSIRYVGNMTFDFETYINNFHKGPRKLDPYTRLARDQATYLLEHLDKEDELFNYLKVFMKSRFNMSHFDPTVTYCPPGSITFPHIDVYKGGRRRLGLDIPEDDNLYKIFTKFWIPMEDRKYGHILEVNGVILPAWNAGDIWTFDDNRNHYAATLGIEPRYFLAISGIHDDVWETL